MPTKGDYSKKILKILAEKPAVSLPELTGKVGEKSSLKAKYALTRSLKGLREAGLVEHINSGQNDYARLTKSGRAKATSYKLEAKSSLVSPNWDGKWRIILLDLPESRKNERESLRYLLKKAGFICLKNSAWISPYPFEHLFTNIKKDLNLGAELMIIVTDSLDEETKKVLFELFGK